MGRTVALVTQTSQAWSAQETINFQESAPPNHIPTVQRKMRVARVALSFVADQVTLSDDAGHIPRGYK